MPDWSYFLAVVAISGAVTVGLRAIPFAALAPLRESSFVRHIGFWMPAGILTILALSTLGTAAEDGHVVAALVAAVVTVAVHLLSGRRSLLSIFAGTLCYVVLVNMHWIGM